MVRIFAILISVFIFFNSFSQDEFDNIIIYQDSSYNKNTFLEGQDIYFFINVKNKLNEKRKNYSIVEFRNIIYGTLTNLTTNEKIENRKIENRNGLAEFYDESIEFSQENIPELIDDLNNSQYQDKYFVDPLYERTIITPNLLRYKSNAFGQEYNSDLLKFKSYNTLNSLSAGKYSIDIICKLGVVGTPISITVFFEVIPLQTDELRNDYFKFLKGIENEILASKNRSYKYTDYTKFTSDGLFSLIKNDSESKYFNEALGVLLYPRDFSLKKEKIIRDKIFLELQNDFFSNPSLFSDFFLQQIMYTYLLPLLDKNKSEIKDYANNILLAFKDHHPTISREIIEYLQTNYGLKGLTNYANSSK